MADMIDVTDVTSADCAAAEEICNLAPCGNSWLEDLACDKVASIIAKHMSRERRISKHYKTFCENALRLIKEFKKAFTDRQDELDKEGKDL